MDLPPPTIPVDADSAYIYELEQKTPLTRECLDVVVERYQIHPIVFSLVHHAEGGWSGAYQPNTDSTHDMGLMQINTVHLPELSRYGLTENMVRNNDCINIGVSAWYINRVTQGITLQEPSDYFRAIARYHSKTPEHNERYAKILEDRFAEIMESYR